MTKEEVFELLTEHLNHIDEKFNSSDKDIYLEAQLRDNLFPLDFAVEAGISKAVILIKGADFVIKIPFYKIYDEDYFSYCHNTWEYNRDKAVDKHIEEHDLEGEDAILPREVLDKIYAKYDAENPEPQCEEESFYYDIQGAQNIDLDGEEQYINDWDYCELECAIYERAEKEGLGAYFAEERYLGEIDNTPVYYQTRCTPMSTMEIDYNSKEYIAKMKMSSKVCDELEIDCFDSLWIADFIQMYGKDELQRLTKFLNKYEIGDLRTCNIGYLDGAPILFDYSSFRDW